MRSHTGNVLATAVSRCTHQIQERNQEFDCICALQWLTIACTELGDSGTATVRKKMSSLAPTALATADAESARRDEAYGALKLGKRNMPSAEELCLQQEGLSLKLVCVRTLC